MSKFWLKCYRAICTVCIFLVFLPSGVSYAKNNSDAPSTDLYASLGELKKIITKPLSAPIIKSPYRYFAGQPGKYYFNTTVASESTGEKQLEIQKPYYTDSDDLVWVRNIGENLIEKWLLKSDGSVHLIAETDKSVGFRVLLKSHMVTPAVIIPGQKWSSTSDLEAYNLDTPDSLDYTGTLVSKWSYIGYYRINVPAGIFDAALVAEEYDIQIGPVKITDKRYSFYVKDFGKVAEVDGMHVSAFLVIHSRKKESKVLVEYSQHSL